MMGDIQFGNIALLLPELYLCIAAMGLLLYGVCFHRPATAFVWLGLVVIAFTGFLAVSDFSEKSVLLNGMFIIDRFAVFAKLLLLAASGLVLMLSYGWLKEGGGRPFEFVILLLLATLGMMLMVSANTLLALYMALEMSSLALYVLASFNRDHAKSSEAGLKYFVLGALASGMMLFGMSLIYGFAGTISFDALAQLFADMEGSVSKAVVVGLVLVIVGFCFKLSAAPFHMWAPDVYEGAPSPVTAFFATAPKVAAFALFVRLLMQPFHDLLAQWQQVIIAASVASMLVGALAAIMQTNIKRLLAYSSIGHVGFMFMAMATGTTPGVQALLIYLSVYIFMSAGMFGCVLFMRRGGHAVEQIKDLAGLWKTHPAMAIAIAIFMFSMAGIPPLSGFFGKWYVVLSALQSGLLPLAVFGILTSVVSGYYYLKVVKVMYFDEPAAPFTAKNPLLLNGAIMLCAFVTLLYFLLPTPLITQALLAAASLGH